MLWRRLLLLGAVLLTAVAAYELWIGYQTSRDLTAARSAVTRLQHAIASDDEAARDEALVDLQVAATSARERTDGPWWGGVTVLPFVGDDASGLRALSASLDVVAEEAMSPLIDAASQLDDVSADGHVDVDVVAALEAPIRDSAQSFRRASDLVSSHNSGGYVDALRTRYDEYAEVVEDLASSIESAQTAVGVLPDMLGADGPRNYLLVFQNNAEIRATGGFAGSLAQVRADDGRLSIEQQFSANDFPTLKRPVLPMTDEERVLYSDAMGRFITGAGFTPDFPRGADLFNAHWKLKFPQIPLDGVLAIDTVSLSYLLEGLGPITVDNVTFTSDNVVQLLLNQVYLTEPDTNKQDEFFQKTARAVFDAATSKAPSPVKLVQGLGRSAGEGRLLVAPFNQTDAERLAGTTVLGEFTRDDGPTPHIDVTVHDATQSKMSYYLRFSSRAKPRSCSSDGAQRVSGTVTLRQTIKPLEAATLPRSVIGSGTRVNAGDQFVFVRIFGPFGGEFEQVSIDGEMVDIAGNQFEGRPVVSAYIYLENTRDVLINYELVSGAGQRGDLELKATPGILPGNSRSVISSAC